MTDARIDNLKQDIAKLEKRASGLRLRAKYASGRTYYDEMIEADKLEAEIPRLKQRLERITKQRRAQLAKIHILAGQQGMDTRDKDPKSAYRQMLQRITGETSTAALDEYGRHRIIQHLDQSYTQRLSGTPQARLIHHIWGCLADAGVVQVREGLPAWLRHFTASVSGTGKGWERPEFLPVFVATRVIEQLKAWANRSGVDWENPK